MTRLITYILIVLGAAMLAGCDNNKDGEYDLPPDLRYTYDNGKEIEVLNDCTIDVTEKQDAFDLSFFSNALFKNISVESSDPQCLAEIAGDPEPKYRDDGRLMGYTQTIHIDMRQEKSIKLNITYHGKKFLFGSSISFSLIRKENQQ